MLLITALGFAESRAYTLHDTSVGSALEGICIENQAQEANLGGSKPCFFFFFWINLYSGFTDSWSSPVAVHVLLQLGDSSYVKGAPP